MSDLIKEVLMGKLFGSGGSSGSGGGVEMTTGTFRTAEDVNITYPNCYAVEHGLGKTPTLILLEEEAMYPSFGISNAFIAMELRRGAGSSVYIAKQILGEKFIGGTVAGSSQFYPTDEVFYGGLITNTQTTKLLANTNYIWYAFYWEDV